MAKRKAFYLYKRKKKGGAYWYVCFINPENGRQGNAKSIDVLKEELNLGSGYRVKDRDSAAIIAGKALEAGIVYPNHIPFTSYCLSFWDYETSQYVKLRNSMRPGAIGREYCKNMTSYYTRHVAPVIGGRTRLCAVTVELLDKVISTALDSGLSTGTVQLIVLSFSVPLKEAARKRLIRMNPADYIMPVPRSGRERGVLSAQEVTALVSLIDSKGQSDRPAQAIKLALASGMRSGELRALKCEDIDLYHYLRDDGITLARIRISKSIAPYTGVKCPKNGKSRDVFIDNTFALELCSAARDDGLVFPGMKSCHKTSVALRDSFYRLLSELGIDEQMRKSRNLTFHSLRHTFNTLLSQERIPIEGRMAALGHSSMSVNLKYTHDSDCLLVDVSRLSSRILAK